MSKFFDATQRANGSDSDGGFAENEKSKRPDLVETIVRSVEADGGENPFLVAAAQRPLVDSFDVSAADAGSAEKAREYSGQAVLADALLDARQTESDQNEIPVRIQSEAGPSDVPLHPAYERIIQRLLAFRRTPRQSVVLFASAVAGEGASTET